MRALRQLLAEYGMIAVVLYLAIFTLAMVATYFAILAGWSPKSMAGTAGAWTAAYLITKITQPLRIAATVVLTPVVGRLWYRLTKRPVPVSAGKDE